MWSEAMGDKENEAQHCTKDEGAREMWHTQDTDIKNDSEVRIIPLGKQNKTKQKNMV